MNLVLNLPLAFAAGTLTILSPCVLPLAPVVVASARSQDPRGPIALALGLAATFGIVGGILASFGVAFGDWDWARAVSAVIMIAIGAAARARDRRCDRAPARFCRPRGRRLG